MKYSVLSFTLLLAIHGALLAAKGASMSSAKRQKIMSKSTTKKTTPPAVPKTKSGKRVAAGVVLGEISRNVQRARTAEMRSQVQDAVSGSLLTYDNTRKKFRQMSQGRSVADLSDKEVKELHTSLAGDTARAAVGMGSFTLGFQSTLDLLRSGEYKKYEPLPSQRAGSRIESAGWYRDQERQPGAPTPRDEQRSAGFYYEP